MANVSNGLTEKMKVFCREYVANGGNGTQAYLAAYNSNSETSASIEASRLLRRDDITAYIASLNKPMENVIQNDREKKRAFLWQVIQDESQSMNDRLRSMDILCKVDAEYTNINVNRNENELDLKNINLSTLKTLSE